MMIVERESMLGGLATAGLVNIPLDFVCGIGADMFRELEAIAGIPTVRTGIYSVYVPDPRAPITWED